MIIDEVTSQSPNAGIGLGTILAVTLSWQRNRSIRLAILAGILSWIYVVRFALTRLPNER